MQNVFKRVVMQNLGAYLTDCRGFVNALHNFIQRKNKGLKTFVFFCNSIYQIIKTYFTEIRFLSLMIMNTTAIATITEITIAMIAAAFNGSFLITL